RAGRSESTPNPKETSPRAVFDRLFRGVVRSESDRAADQRRLFEQSILDYVREDAAQLGAHLGAADVRRLDEYMTSIREIERRIQRADQAGVPVTVGMPRPAGIPRDYRDHIRLLTDLLVLAFQTDSTRISTF